MAINIGPKIGVEGESEYKKQLQGIIEKSKSLNAEMEAVSKGFREAGDDSTDFEKKAEVLGRQIKNQQEIIDGYKKMLDLSAKATGENSTETSQYEAKLYKAQGRMADLQNQLEGLTNEEDANADQTEEVGDSVEDLGKDMDDTKEKTSIFAETLKSQLTAQAIINGIKAIAGAVKEIADSVKEAFTSTVEWADELDTLSTQTGISTTELQKLEYMSGLIDTDVTTVTGSMTKLTKAMNSASSGTGASADAFKELGVNVTDSNGELRNSYDVFYEVIDALGKIENPTERDAKAMEIFGKSAKELNNMIEAGSDTLKAFGDEAVSTGYVLSEEAVGNIASISDSFDRIKNAGDSAIRNSIAPLAPAISEMATQAVPIIQEVSQAFAQLFSGDMTAGDFTAMIMEKINELLAWVEENIPLIMSVGSEIITSILNGIAEGDIAGQAIELITTLIDSISENLPQLFEAGMNAIMSLIEGITSPSSIGSLVNSGINLIISLTRGLIEAIPQIIQAIPTIIQNLVVAVTENAPMLIVGGIELTLALIEGFISTIPDLITMLPEIGYRIIEAFGKVDWASIGKNIVDGILGGLSSMWNTLVNKAKEMASKVLSTVKGALGIHSPSKVFQDQVGKMIPAGLEKGIDKGMPSVIKDMENQMSGLVFGASASLEGATAVATGGTSSTMNYGGFVINVNAQDGQSARDIADEVMYRIQSAVNRREAVFA